MLLFKGKRSGFVFSRINSMGLFGIESYMAFVEVDFGNGLPRIDVVGLPDATKTALRCGVARSTLYRWINRGKEEGKSELSDKSKRPSRLANMKITPEIETIILNLRETRRWGTQRIANYLLRKRIKLSAMTVLFTKTCA